MCFPTLRAFVMVNIYSYIILEVIIRDRQNTVRLSTWVSSLSVIMENTWHHRKVAETAQKACMICFKPSSSVLITADSKDFFYICPAHLKDRNFAVPTEDEAKALEDKKKKEAMDREIELIKKEYEDKMKRKKEKQDKKDGKKDEKSKKEDEKSEDQLEKEKEDKVRPDGCVCLPVMLIHA